jgi:hypothetical protein
MIRKNMSEVMDMKKFILGVIVGIAVATTSSVYADEIKSVIGKSIDGELPVKIAGKELDTQAIVVEGTSYLPVRAVGESLNMEVTYDASTGVELKQKGAAMTGATVPFDKEALRIRLEKNNQILELKNKQRDIIAEIPQYSNIVMSADHKKRTEENFEYNDEYYEAKRIWEEKKAEIAAIEEQIKAIQNP